LLGNHKPGTFDEKEFIITPTFELLLQQLTSIISVSDFAIILEGPTSAGKTSCI
jgi:midasin (ATPase involved in ribosome maturation)